MSVNRTKAIAATLVGGMAALLTFNLESLSTSGVISLLMPGMILAMAVAGNVHAWPLWIATLGNFLFYFGFAWLASALWLKFRYKD